MYKIDKEPFEDCLLSVACDDFSVGKWLYILESEECLGLNIVIFYCHYGTQAFLVDIESARAVRDTIDNWLEDKE